MKESDVIFARITFHVAKTHWHSFNPFNLAAHYAKDFLFFYVEELEFFLLVEKKW